MLIQALAPLALCLSIVQEQDPAPSSSALGGATVALEILEAAAPDRGWQIVELESTCVVGETEDGQPLPAVDVRLRIEVTGPGGAAAEAVFRELEELATEQVEQLKLAPLDYDRCRAQLLTRGLDRRALPAGGEGAATDGTHGIHYGVLRLRIPASVIGSFPRKERKPIQADANSVAMYLRTVAQDEQVQLGNVTISPLEGVREGRRGWRLRAPSDRKAPGLDATRVMNGIYLFEVRTQALEMVRLQLQSEDHREGMRLTVEFEADVK